MNTIRAFGLLLGSGIACGSAYGGTLAEGHIAGQVQQFVKSGRVEGCGVTFAAIELPRGAPAGDLLMFNGSFVLYTFGGGLVKARASNVDAASFGKGGAKPKSATLPPLQKFWLKAPNAPATSVAPGTSIQASDDPGYRIYASEFQSIFALIQSALDEKPVQISGLAQGHNFERGLYGVINMSEADRSQLAQCMAEWAKPMVEQAEAKE